LQRVLARMPQEEASEPLVDIALAELWDAAQEMPASPHRCDAILREREGEGQDELYEYERPVDDGDNGDGAIAERLCRIRARRGFKTGSAAARAFGWKVSTYLAHEGGERLSRKAAARYARAYNVPLRWLLRGDGVDPDHSIRGDVAGAPKRTVGDGIDSGETPTGCVSGFDIFDRHARASHRKLDYTKAGKRNRVEAWKRVRHLDPRNTEINLSKLHGDRTSDVSQPEHALPFEAALLDFAQAAQQKRSAAHKARQEQEEFAEALKIVRRGRAKEGISPPVPKACPKCDGSGYELINCRQYKCLDCDGTGLVEDAATPEEIAAVHRLLDRPRQGKNP
jgi:hypothetical protein